MSESINDDSFWEKVKDFAKKAGAEVIEKSLCLYYTAQHEDTPAWARTVIYGALAYFILPVDAIPDVIPVAGFTDDLGALAAATATVAVHITEEIKEQAREKMKVWFD